MILRRYHKKEVPKVEEEKPKKRRKKEVGVNDGDTTASKDSNSDPK